MYYPTNFDDVMKSSFSVIPKITSGNLCKPIHDIINFPLLFVLSNVKSVERKEKITKT